MFLSQMPPKWVHEILYHVPSYDCSTDGGSVEKESEKFLDQAADILAYESSRDDVDYTAKQTNLDPTIFIRQRKDGSKSWPRYSYHRRRRGGYEIIIARHYPSVGRAHLHIVYYKTNNDSRCGPQRSLDLISPSRGDFIRRRETASCLRRLKQYFNNGEREMFYEKVASRCTGKWCCCDSDQSEGEHERRTGGVSICDDSDGQYDTVRASYKRLDNGSLGRRSEDGSNTEFSCKDVRATQSLREHLEKGPGRKRKINGQSLEAFIEKVWSNSPEETETLVRCDPELSDFLYDRDFDRKLKTAYGNVRARYRQFTWSQILTHIPDVSSLSMLSPADSAHVILTLFNLNHFPRSKLEKLFKICRKQIPKVNCIWFNGPPNSGKSVVGLSLASSFRFYSTCNKFDQSSDFGFSQMYNQCCLLIDECSVNTHNFEVLKMIAGGQEVSVNVKNKDHTVIGHTPVILCTNHWLTHFCVNAGAALKQFLTRCEVYNFVPQQCLSRLPTNRLHPKAWDLIAFDRTDVSLDYYSDNFDGMFNVANYFDE